ncbi:MAG: hypothetical protein V8Q75_03530 [Bacilli bacterium]
MKISKGTKLKVYHKRHGIFYGIAIKDFDTDTEEFYPIELDQDMLCGLSTDWVRGDNIPCRNTLCEIKEVK